MADPVAAAERAYRRSKDAMDASSFGGRARTARLLEAWKALRDDPPSPDWRQPYRSMDASGGPDTAGAVGLAWIEETGQRLMRWYGGMVNLETSGDSQGTQVMALYHGTKLVACATVFRDPMNFAVLVRWMAQPE